MGKKRKKQARSLAPAGHGFDFGERPVVAAMTDTSFNQALIDGKVIGCAYGFSPIPGFSNMIPLLTFVGTNAERLRDAFEQFRAWGCEDDGDVVDIHLLLNNDGTYRAWLGPETRRLLFRCIPQADLFDPLVFNLSWIKEMDTTNPFLFELKEYLSGKITPVAISAATIPTDKTLAPSNLIEIPDLPAFVKFDLRILHETDCPDDARFKPLNGVPQPRSHQTSPKDQAEARERLFDVAFPVLRERVRRSGLYEDLRKQELLNDVREVQVVQAIANLILSDELNPGDRHYLQLAGDRSQQIWEHLRNRREWADGNDPVPGLSQDAVTQQIELDVRHVLARRGVPTAPMRFASLQQMFLRKGYAA